MVTGGGTVSPAGVAGPGVIAGSVTGCMSTSTPTPGADTAGLPPQRRTSENRRSNKPIMEKRRRARINNCLNELKTLILDAMKKDPARHSKLEKADILEMTVKHLENLQRQQVAMSAATDPSVLNKFRAGFSECAGEVGRFPGLESPVRRRLLQHLANCLNGTNNTTSTTSSGTATPQPSPQDSAPAPSQHQTAVQVHILPPATSTPTADGHQAPTPISSSSNGIFFTTGANGAGLQLVPTRLPNGDIALVLPSSGSSTAQIFRQTATITTGSPSSSPAPSSSSSSPLPMLIPIPTRTSSTASASSSSSSTSSCVSTSPIAFDRLAVSSPPQMSAVVVTPPVCRDMATSPTAYHLPVSPSGGRHHNNGGYDVAEQKPRLRPYSPLQKPLALVVKKESVPEVPSVEEKPWRPW
ncbi:protein hairy [Zootermopsis nevadensis]|uniref:Protein hairy n=1 Tax=Zootermopsis nevadensis TaxID=136037 RepID=A0A067QJU3_ZOONE|nr:protein hairy [Zootermopsis nevadensis]KDR07936.1 Protein hairy [Zootermopsis nevadensis]